MKRMLVVAAAITAFGFVSAAGAADMPVKAVRAPIIAPAYNWTGFYVGGNVGYGWGNGDTSFGPLPTAAAFVNLAPQTLSPNPKGVLGGLQAGYNWQTGQWVWGVETDFQWSGMTGSVTQTPIIQNNGTPFPGAGFVQAGEKMRWFGTLRARAGFTPMDRVLLYATGGLAYGNVHYTSTTDFRPVGTTQYIGDITKTKAGWTIGAGAECAFAQMWTAKFEYLYYDLGKENVTVNATPLLPPFQVAYSWKTTGNIVRLGVNYKF
ncbi:MAG TPA: outer membrane protein [Pseudolabrys sp.]|jgi:outer membrane immunogenic protein